MKPRQLLLFVLLLRFIWAPPSLCAQQPPGPDFNSLRQLWIQNLEARKLEPALALYAADATFVNADGTHVAGAGLRNLFETVFREFRATITMTSRASEFSCNLAYESGSYDERVTVSATGEQKRVTGDYMTIYRASRDKWLIAQQVWTQAPGK